MRDARTLGASSMNLEDFSKTGVGLLLKLHDQGTSFVLVLHQPTHLSCRP